MNENPKIDLKKGKRTHAITECPCIKCVAGWGWGLYSEEPFST